MAGQICNKKFLFILTLSSLTTGVHCGLWDSAFNYIAPIVVGVAKGLATAAVYAGNAATTAALYTYDSLKPVFQIYIVETFKNSYLAKLFNKLYGEDPIADYFALREFYSLVEPWQMPRDKKFTDLRNSTGCNCPRVFMPVCGKNNVTYVNACIMNCWRIEMRRVGTCIIYRRNVENWTMYNLQAKLEE